MADSSTGIAPIGDYDGAATAADAIDNLIALIPNVDTESSSGSNQGGMGFLDEMSPVAAVQLRVELNALKDAIGAYAGA